MVANTWNPAIKRQKYKDQEFKATPLLHKLKANLGYIENLSQNKQTSETNLKKH